MKRINNLYNKVYDIDNKLITNKEYNILLSSYKGILKYGNCNSLYIINRKASPS